jgi:hypothetical protein
MQIVKKVFIALAAIVVLLLVVALFVKKDYAVERNVVVNRPVESVFNYIKYLKNMDNYSVWAQRDPNMKKTFSGEDGTVGAISTWDSENPDVGKGEQEITNIVANQRMDFELRFKEPFEATDQAYFIVQAINDSTTNVKWGFTGSMDYPMNLLLLTMDMEKMVGGDLQTGLDNLKKLLESQPVTQSAPADSLAN